MSEPISLMAFFGASKGVVGISIRIAKSLKLIESIESKVDLLTQVEFNTAWKTLIQACNSSSSDEQKSFIINDARDSFTKATCLEKRERLFYTYLGLAICHYLTDDINNVKTALIEATKVSIYKDFYQQTRDSYLGFNKYGINTVINSYNPVNMVNLIKGLFAYPLLKVQKIEIQIYNKSKSDSTHHILRKINAEEKIITLITKANQPSVVFTTLESNSLELINLQKQCIEIITNI